MTHRLQDAGKTPQPYDDPDYDIVQGYDKDDRDLVSEYLSG
jgi:hypothetical protein